MRQTTASLAFATILSITDIAKVYAVATTQAPKSILPPNNSGSIQLQQNPISIKSKPVTKLQSSTSVQQSTSHRSQVTGQTSSQVIINSLEPREVKRRGIEVKYRLNEIASRCGLEQTTGSLDWMPSRDTPQYGLETTVDLINLIWRPIPFTPFADEKTEAKIYLYPDLKDVPTDKLVYELELESPNRKACTALQAELYALQRVCNKGRREKPEFIQQIHYELANVARLAIKATLPPDEEEEVLDWKRRAEISKYKLESRKADQEYEKLWLNQHPAEPRNPQ